MWLPDTSSVVNQSKIYEISNKIKELEKRLKDVEVKLAPPKEPEWAKVAPALEYYDDKEIFDYPLEGDTFNVNFVICENCGKECFACWKELDDNYPRNIIRISCEHCG